MIFSKPVYSLTLADIEGLTSGGEPESMILDYKETVAGTERDKKELAKDVSAMANSVGGLILIGVAETKARPEHPPCGTPRMLGTQKVEEWLDQVITSNIAPRAPFTMAVVDHTDADRCVVAISVQTSPRAPHMVTSEHRYFKRHQYHSLQAEEYEVRELFQRSSRMRSEVADFVKRRGFEDQAYGEYASNSFTSKLHLETNVSSWVVLTACPEVFTAGVIPVKAEEYWQWMEPSLRLYPPLGIFVPHERSRPVSHGSLHFNLDRPETPKWRTYLYVHDTGFIEMGLTLANSFDDGLIAFALVPLVAKYWQFVRFTLDLYSRYGLQWPFDAEIHLRNTNGTGLYNLGQGWREPFDKTGRGYRPQCIEPHVRITSPFSGIDVPDDVLEQRIRDAAADIDFAFGSRESRALTHAKVDPGQGLDAAKAGAQSYFS